MFDPEREETISYHNPRTHHMNIDYNAYEGFAVKGCADTVISRGRVIVADGEYVGRKGDGAFVKRGPYGGLYATADRRAVIDALPPAGRTLRRAAE